MSQASPSPTKRIRKVLIANRGEIACRILRTLKDMGLESVAVYSDADRRARFVAEADEAIHIGPAPSTESYLKIEAVVDAARRSGADAVHPGYGFLSENADFVEACEEAGLIFVGPPAGAVRAMGLKGHAKDLARQAGLPVLDGFPVDSGGDPEATSVAQQAETLGFPLLVKASAGGGGRGLRGAREASELEGALSSARREALAAFGDGSLIIERYLSGPRHVEIQILADAHGSVLHAFERDGTVQRRHQKVVEEAPCPALGPDLRRQMGEAAVALARAVGYRGLGTVEFLLEPSAGKFYFLEMNTRLQVEHPVTEAVLGLDLVRLQLDIADGRPLPFTQDDLRISGHAVEARLYAEDPDHGYLPSAGTLSLWHEPELPGLRIDSGVRQGDAVSVFYDPLLAKLVAHGEDRAQALRRLRRGLQEIAVGGVRTNRELLLRIADHELFHRDIPRRGVAGTASLSTTFLDNLLLEDPPPSSGDGIDLHAVGAAVRLFEDRRAASSLPSTLPAGWRNLRRRPQVQSFNLDGEDLVVTYESLGPGAWRMDVSPGPYDPAGSAPPFPTREVRLLGRDGDVLDLELGGIRRRIRVTHRHEGDGGILWVHAQGRTHELRTVSRFPRPRAADASSGGCLAPMTGKVIEVGVQAGDQVETGQVLVVLEAMKMEHRMTASHAGRVAAVHVEVGQMVDPDKVLVRLEPLARNGEAPP